MTKNLNKGFDHLEWLDSEIKKINEIRKTLIESTVRSDLDDKIINEYFNEAFSDYHFDSSSIYTEAFLKILKQKLSSPEKFLKANKEVRAKKALDIYTFFKIEDSFKSTVKRSHFNNKILTGKYNTEIRLFKKLVKEMLAETNVSIHVSQKFFYNKVIESLKELTSYLIEHEVLKAEQIDFRKIKWETYFEIFEKQINLLFTNLVKVFLDKVFMNFAITTELKAEKVGTFLHVKRQSFYHGFLLDFLIYIYTIFSENYIKDHQTQSTVMFIYKNKKAIIEQSLIPTAKAASIQIMEVFVRSVNSEIIKVPVENKRHSEIYLSLPLNFQDGLPFSVHLPEIVPPKNWNSRGELEDQTLLKPIFQGATNVVYSDKTIKAINLSQKKCFKINTTFLQMLDMEDTLDINREFLPFPTLQEMKDQLGYTQRLKAGYSLKKSESSILKFIHKTENSVPGKDGMKFFQRSQKIKKLLNISNLNLQLNYKYLQELKRLKNFNRQRQIYLSVLSLAELYIKFPIYYQNFVCYRLRMYPWNWIFSRTTGFYKYLLEDFKSKKINKAGLYNLIYSYYFHTELCSKFIQDFPDHSKYNEKKLFDFFDQNEIDNTGSGNFLYFELLKKEILKLKGGSKSSAHLIEIDQKSSCGVFLSLLLGNAKLGEITNLTGEQNQNLNKYLRENTQKFFIKKEYNSPRVLDFFVNQKDPHKKAFMNFCFSQKSEKRFELWVELFQESNTLTELERNILFKFSANYSAFLNELFPKLAIQTKALKEIIVYFLQYSTQGLKIKTIDESIIYWNFFKSESEIVRYYSFIGKKYTSFRSNKISDEPDLKKHKRAFLPGIIHSLDAGFMRLLILRVHEQTGYVINHLHDSIQIHPNYCDKLYEVLNELYTGDTFEDLPNKVLFKPMLEELPPNRQKVLNRKIKKFNDLRDTIIIPKNKFNSKHVYPFEG